VSASRRGTAGRARSAPRSLHSNLPAGLQPSSLVVTERYPRHINEPIAKMLYERAETYRRPGNVLVPQLAPALILLNSHTSTVIFLLTIHRICAIMIRAVVVAAADLQSQPPRFHPTQKNFSAKSFACHTSEKLAHKSFICHTSKIIKLKVLCLPHLRKNQHFCGSVAGCRLLFVL
jgi:hypothetical protein